METAPTQPNTQLVISPITQKEESFWKRTRRLTVEILAPLIWVFVFVKLFVFDVDAWLFKQLWPQYVWLLNLRFVFLMLVMAGVWWAFGTKQFLKTFSFILFYPLLLIFVFIPWMILKQKSWTLAFGVINSTVSFVKSLKRTFITAAVFLAAYVAVIISSNPYTLGTAVIVLLVLLALVYWRKFWYALKPAEVFGVQIKLFKGARKIGRDTYTLDEDVRNLPFQNLNPQQLQKWTEKLQTAVLFNRCCLFVVRKLRDFRNSPWQIVPPIMSVLFLIVFTAFTFAGINIGLFKINPGLYQYTGHPGFFTMFYYSFNKFVFNGINELVASAPLSQSVAMMQEFCALLLVSIILTLYISVKSERNSNELNEVIAEIEKEGESMEQFIRDEYKIGSISDALSELGKLKASLVTFLYKISENI